MENWYYISFEKLKIIIFSVLIVFSCVVLISRIFGLRTFAKMSSFDFASTIAIGSIIASVIINTDHSLFKGIVALSGIIAFQTLFAFCKQKFPFFETLFTNKPVLLMKDGKFIVNNLKKTNVSAKDVYAKLREANVKDMSEILAVILESTGDISVIHSDKDKKLSKEILTGVKQ